MGFLGEIKKLLFGVTSVSKSAAEKATEAGKDLGSKVMDNTSDVLSKAKDFSLDAGDSIMDKVSDLKDAALGTATDAGESFGSTLSNIKDKALDGASNLKDKIADNPAVEKAAGFTEKVGEQVIEKGGILADKGMDLSEKVGEKVLEAKDKMVDKAKEITGQLGEKLDETIEKAEAMAEADKNKPEFAEEPINLDDSLLDGTDDFFSKADQYAKGEYDAFSTEPKISKDPTAQIEKPAVLAAGFEDLDGDGDEIADDAIILGEEE